MFSEYVLDPFLTAVKNFGHKKALCINEEFYLYKDFAENISKIRKEIKTASFSSNNIALVANDDIETYASIFAIWLEGYAYVALHPDQPIARNKEIISQADVSLIIDSSVSSVFLDTAQVIPSSGLVFSEMDLKPNEISDDQLAYILFTSGSTGQPKGVQISRKNVASFIKSFLEVGFAIDENDRCLQCFDLTFDVSVQSYLIPLIHGACMYTVPHNEIKFSYVYGLMDDHELTFGAMAPSLVRFLRPYFDEIDIPSMRYAIVTAEASPVDLIEEWSACIPKAELFNFYGPTEATVYSTYYKWSRTQDNKHLNGMLCIGKALNGFQSIILDESGKELPVGEKGELCVSGPQLTPGYWNNPEKTSEMFFDKEVNNELLRFYKTGDLCYVDAEGDIHYSGRLDTQVKIQGYRIELSEIEFYARQFNEGKNAVTLVFNDPAGNVEIVLFTENDAEEDTAVLSFLKSKLPSYMIPKRVVVCKEFPLNANGKVDKNELRKLY